MHHFSEVSRIVISAAFGHSSELNSSLNMFVHRHGAPKGHYNYSANRTFVPNGKFDCSHAPKKFNVEIFLRIVRSTKRSWVLPPGDIKKRARCNSRLASLSVEVAVRFNISFNPFDPRKTV